MAQSTRRRSPPVTAAGKDSRDVPVARGSELTIMNALRQYKMEAQQGREPRLRKNKRNWDIYLGIRDWSKKQKGQSTEQTPLLEVAEAQISAFIQRALTDVGDWFAAELYSQQIMTNQQAKTLLAYQLDSASSGGTDLDGEFPTLVADAVTAGLLGSLLIFKVHGKYRDKLVFQSERGVQYRPQPDGSELPTISSEMVRRRVSTWQLVLDLVPAEDYYPDPYGRGLYEGHEVERDLWQVQKMAAAGTYDQAIVDQIEEDCAREEERYWSTLEAQRDDRTQTPPGFRKRVVIFELWGSILDERGKIVEENVLCAMANNKYLIRPPEPNPYWHGERPFVTGALERVPFSVWHKASFDKAAELNVAHDELLNLILDGGIAAAWGTKVVYPDNLDDPAQIQDGIPQGATLIARQGLPPNAKVLESIAGGRVPQDSLLTLQMLKQEFETASQVNAVRMAQALRGGATATAVTAAEQTSSSVFDAKAKHAERTLRKVLHLSWCNIMQFLDDADAEEVITAVGERAALMLNQMRPAERYEAFAGCKFRVHGLSTVLARMRHFQKLVALLQIANQGPVMAMSFVQRFSPKKVWDELFKSMNIDPSTLEPDEQERLQMGQTQQLLQQQLVGGQAGAAGGSPPGVSMPSDVPNNLPEEQMPASAAGGY
jgi:hypothetical protein